MSVSIITLKALKDKRGWTVLELAGELGISERQAFRLLSGESPLKGSVARLTGYLVKVDPTQV